MSLQPTTIHQTPAFQLETDYSRYCTLKWQLDIAVTADVVAFFSPPSIKNMTEF